MPCFWPRKAYWKAKGAGITFSAHQGLHGRAPVIVPCGQCTGCRVDHAIDWETRLYHECQLHERMAFLTLTYNDVWLPDDYGVHKRELQLFMKRLRKAIQPIRVRFFACGEYGDTNFRPHYHLILFGYDFPDMVPWRKTGSGFVVYRSSQLDSIWGMGHAEIGTVTPQSCGYVARYVLKKVNGKLESEHYTRPHPLTGEVNQVSPEFVIMSNRPGIGHGWFEQFSGDAFPSDFVIVDGKKRPIPRYYDKKMALSHDRMVRDVKERRSDRAQENADNNTPERLQTREEVLKLRLRNLKRELDTEQ